VTAREIGRVTIAEALELTALVARKQPERDGRFAARWLCLWLEEHEKATLNDVAWARLDAALSRLKGLRAGARDPEEEAGGVCPRLLQWASTTFQPTSLAGCADIEERP
jgi:hypothetical protein